jgi:prolipoprotein diacylglyceryltransferase
VRKRRIPVQFLEMGWWVLGSAVFLAAWPTPVPSGSYALGVLGWYGAGRFFLEPLRERPDLILGRIRINQVVAGLLAVIAAAVTLTRILGSQ